jgi:hypothetical protein
MDKIKLLIGTFTYLYFQVLFFLVSNTFALMGLKLFPAD